MPLFIKKWLWERLYLCAEVIRRKFVTVNGNKNVFVSFDAIIILQRGEFKTIKSYKINQF